MNNQLKVLFVDDDKDLLESFSAYLKIEGYFVDTFETIETAITALNKYNYAVSIINMKFPHDPEGGVRIINHITENIIDTIPIILICRESLQNLKKIFYNIYSYIYIEKNENTMNNLLKQIKIALNLKQSEKNSNETEDKLKIPIYQSAHTFEKCYNIPLRNLCFRLRQNDSLDYQKAKNLMHLIDF